MTYSSCSTLYFLPFQAVRALNHYNKPQGAEAVLHNMLMEKRHRAAVAAAAGQHGGGAGQGRCLYDIRKAYF